MASFTDGQPIVTSQADAMTKIVFKPYLPTVRTFKIGDIVSSEGETQVARECPNCFGSGVECNGYLLTYTCPTCGGLKYVMVKVTNVTTDTSD